MRFVKPLSFTFSILCNKLLVQYEKTHGVRKPSHAKQYIFKQRVQMVIMDPIVYRSAQIIVESRRDVTEKQETVRVFVR